MRIIIYLVISLHKYENTRAQPDFIRNIHFTDFIFNTRENGS